MVRKSQNFSLGREEQVSKNLEEQLAEAKQRISELENAMANANKSVVELSGELQKEQGKVSQRNKQIGDLKFRFSENIRVILNIAKSPEWEKEELIEALKEML